MSLGTRQISVRIVCLFLFLFSCLAVDNRDCFPSEAITTTFGGSGAKRVCPRLVENVEESTLDIIKITVIILLQWADRVGARERTRRIFALCCVVPTS